MPITTITTPYGLSDFGWNANLSPSAQVPKIQAALDSGEMIILPIGQEMQIDAPLEVTKASRLLGGGPNWFGTVEAPTVLRSVVPGIDMIRVTGNNAEISGLTLVANQTGCTGVVVGDGTTGKTTRGLRLDRIGAHPSLMHGIYYKAAQDCLIADSHLSGYESAYRVESNISGDPASADAGDNMVRNCRILGVTGKPGMHWISGGGQYIVGCKFLSGKHHILIDATGNKGITGNWGISGNLILADCSMESCSSISVDMHGNYTFKRALINAVNWGGVLMAVASRNYYASNWCEDLSIQNCTATCENPGANAIMDLGCVKNALISGNRLNGNGSKTWGIEVRASAGGIPSTGRIFGNHITDTTQGTVKDHNPPGNWQIAA